MEKVECKLTQHLIFSQVIYKQCTRRSTADQDYTWTIDHNNLQV